MKLGAVTDFERPGGRFAATPAGMLAATPGGMLPTPVPQPLGHKSTDQYCLLIIIENGNNNSSNSKIYYVISYHIISDQIRSCHVMSYHIFRAQAFSVALLCLPLNTFFEDTFPGRQFGKGSV